MCVFGDQAEQLTYINFYAWNRKILFDWFVFRRISKQLLLVAIDVSSEEPFERIE